MAYNYSLYYKIISGAGFREKLLLDYSRNCRFESVFYDYPDDKGYYRISFFRLRECKIFLKCLFFSPNGFCLEDAYIVSHNSGFRLRAVFGYCLIDHRKRYYLSFKKF